MIPIELTGKKTPHFQRTECHAKHRWEEMYLSCTSTTNLAERTEIIPRIAKKHLQGEPLPVINGVITPI